MYVPEAPPPHRSNDHNQCEGYHSRYDDRNPEGYSFHHGERMLNGSVGQTELTLETGGVGEIGYETEQDDGEDPVCMSCAVSVRRRRWTKG